MPVNIPTSLSSIKTDPIRNFKFQVNIASPTGTPTNSLVKLGFTSVSGLAVTTESIPYRQGGFNAQPLSAKVLTTNGFKAMGDIEAGDRLIDPRGDESKVTGVYPQGVRDIYQVRLRDGSTAEACYQHLWEANLGTTQAPKVVDTLDLKARVERGQRVRLPIMQPAQFDALDELPIDPYVMGVLISEGALDQGAKFEQSWANIEVIERVAAALPAGHTLNHFGANNGCHHITVGQGGAATARNVTGRNLIVTALRELGLFGKRSHEKFIPEIYKYASIEDRVALLQGIFDGDGTIYPNGRIMYGSSSERLRDDVRALISSLGGHSTTGIVTNVWYTSPTQATPKTARDSYRLNSVHLPMNPFHLPAKAERFKAKNGAYHRTVVAVDYLRSEAVQCIAVSAPSHLYVTDDYLPTHNTTVQNIPGQSSFTPITLSRGVVLGTAQAWNWMRSMFSVIAGGGTLAAGGDFRTTVEIWVLDHPTTTDRDGITNGQTTTVKLKFKLYNAWINSLTYSELNAGDNALMVEQMVLVHEGFDMKWADNSPGGEAGTFTV